MNYEGEMALVFGKVTRNVTREEAWDCIAGFAPSNDFGCHDFRDTDAGSMLRVKGMDGFCPIGPGLVSGVDVRQSTLRSYKNGKMVQEGAVSEQIFDCGYLIADLARHMTFLPGDILLTGTPANSRPLEAGDTIDVEVTGVGRLSNKVVEIPAPRATEGFPPAPTAKACAAWRSATRSACPTNSRHSQETGFMLCRTARSRSLMVMSERDARGPEEHDPCFDMARSNDHGLAWPRNRSGGRSPHCDWKPSSALSRLPPFAALRRSVSAQRSWTRPHGSLQ